MLLSEKLLHATEAVLYIAYHHEKKHASRSVEQELSLPLRYLEPIFQRLVRHQLLQSTRGPGGGYSLAKEPDHITLADIVLALQEDGKLRARYAPSHPLGMYVLEELRETLSKQMITQLETVTVLDLIKQAERSNI